MGESVTARSCQQKPSPLLLPFRQPQCFPLCRKRIPLLKEHLRAFWPSFKRPFILFIKRNCPKTPLKLPHLQLICLSSTFQELPSASSNPCSHNLGRMLIIGLGNLDIHGKNFDSLVKSAAEPSISHLATWIKRLSFLRNLRKGWRNAYKGVSWKTPINAPHGSAITPNNPPRGEGSGNCITCPPRPGALIIMEAISCTRM